MKSGLMLGVALMLALGGTGAGQAQMRTVDPNQASDLAAVPASEANYGTRVSVPAAGSQEAPAPQSTEAAAAEVATQDGAMSATAQNQAATASASNTYAQDDVLSAAEGVFGKGAEGLAKLVEKIFKEQGSPNAYIAGREASGAVVIGLRYGSGMMFHKIEGERKVYWTGPSVGFDLGGDASKVFVLVYNLYDSQELYKRFPAGEGRVYFVGGFSASDMRRGDVVLIPVRLGVGWRVGINAGYMKFTERKRWLPF